MEFPYGKAPFVILIVAIASGIALYASRRNLGHEDHDLSFVVFAKPHYQSYLDTIPIFEEQNDIKVSIQLADWRALRSRLAAALLSDSNVPDMVEMNSGSIGYFTKGPLDDVGFVDLTPWIEAEGLRERLVESRFGLWMSRGRIFCLPHDVHPVSLVYRRDIVEDELGIDVADIKTWDDFARIAREKIVRDLDGDGTIDRYAIDFTSSGGASLRMLLLQRGGGVFDREGNVTMDDELAVDTVVWFVKQSRGEDRISFSAGWGQTFAKAMLDGLVLFYMTPDWRSKLYETDTPSLEGKMAMMPLPVWEEGGCRTSTWGGTGVAITKSCETPELAWEMAKFLYFNPDKIQENFRTTNIINPLKETWDLPAYKEPNEFYSGQVIGEIYTELAVETPPEYFTAYTDFAFPKMDAAILAIAKYYETNGEDGLREFARQELKKQADYVRRIMEDNRFLQESPGEDGSRDSAQAGGEGSS